MNNKRRSQVTIEYLLLLAMMAGLVIMFIVLFHKKAIGMFFTIVGLILGAGTPQ